MKPFNADFLEIDHSFKNKTIFIDPPYSGASGKQYKYNKVNYEILKNIVQSLSMNNQVIACENEELKHNWGNFNKFRIASGMRGKKKELCFIN